MRSHRARWVACRSTNCRPVRKLDPMHTDPMPSMISGDPNPTSPSQCDGKPTSEAPAKRRKREQSDGVPPNGTLQHGAVRKVSGSKPLVSAPHRNIQIVNEGFRSEALLRDGTPRVPPANYPTWQSKTLGYWATPRLSGSGACCALTKRGAGDLATQLRFEASYAAAHPGDPSNPTKPPSDRGNVVNPGFVEWMMGLPSGWTSTAPMTPSPSPTVPHRIRTLDLFTGCGGLTLGLHPWCQSTAYCEVHPKYRAILEARVASSQLDNAPIFNDVKTLHGSDLDASIEMIVAGFPCQNISNAGDKTGLQGPKSGLFFEVARLISSLKPPYVLLENVSAITSAGMADVLRTVVSTLDDAGYDAQWGLFEARHAGAPHRRKRWFLLACRRDVGWERLRSLVPAMSVQEQAHLAKTWQPEPTLDERLLFGCGSDTKTRLETMGNMVCTAQAALAFRYLVHGGLQRST